MSQRRHPQAARQRPCRAQTVPWPPRFGRERVVSTCRDASTIMDSASSEAASRRAAWMHGALSAPGRRRGAAAGLPFAQRPIGGHAGVRKTSEPAGKSGQIRIVHRVLEDLCGREEAGREVQQSGACRRATPPCRRSHSRRHKQLGTPREGHAAISPSGWRRQLPRKSVRQS